ncbi:MAG: hypothetical protein AABY86_04720, partial [Bdellovibrionota bacterium]
MAQKPEYCRVPVETIQRHSGDFPFDVYLRLSDEKLVRVVHGHDDVKATVAHYVAKGIKEIYAVKEDYAKFVELVNRELTAKFFDVQTSSQEKMEILQNSYNVLKESFMKVGLSQASINLARDLAKNSGELISKQAVAKDIFAQFKGKCSSEYVRSLFVGTVVLNMLDHLDWQTDSVRQHVMESLLLRDILLLPEHFVNIRDCVRSWPNAASRFLSYGSQS